MLHTRGLIPLLSLFATGGYVYFASNKLRDAAAPKNKPMVLLPPRRLLGMACAALFVIFALAAIIDVPSMLEVYSVV